MHSVGRFEGADEEDKAHRTLDQFSFFVSIQDKRRTRERVSDLDEVGELALACVSADGFVGSDLGEATNQRSSKPVRCMPLSRQPSSRLLLTPLLILARSTHKGASQCYRALDCAL